MGFTILSRGLQFVAGIGSLLLIASFLSPVEQGFYYTFYSFLSLQVFFELGLSYVLMQYSSHERANLAWSPAGTLEGDLNSKQRLHLLLRKALRWYGAATVLMVVLMIPAGIIFFGRSPDASRLPGWQIPWIWLVLTTAGSVLLSPLQAVLEGCGLVAEVAGARLKQDLAGYIFLWGGFFLGAGLFASPIMQTVRVLVMAAWIARSKKTFLLDLFGFRGGASALNWRREVWPMQWKIAVSWLSGFFISQLFNPVLFAIAGAKVAGQMGMSLSITTAINTVAMAWMNTKAPLMGRLIARKEYAELDQVFFRTLAQAFSVSLFGGIAVMTAAWLMNDLGLALADRLLDPLPLLMLVLVTMMNVLVYSEAVYLRAHKQEPLLFNSVVTGVLTASSTVVLGRLYGVVGMTAGYCLVTLVAGAVWVTVLFFQKRRLWHALPG